MTETLYQYLSASLQREVDQIIATMQRESWPTRFLYLFGLLCDRLEKRTNPDPSLLLQQWCAIVTAYLEKERPDSSVMECLALMSMSYNDEWLAQALAQIERDPTVLDRLYAAYPAWADVVESVAEARAKLSIRK